MAELYHLDVVITDEMTSTEEIEAFRAIYKAVNMIVGGSMNRGRRTFANQAVQAVCAAAANIEIAAGNWDGPSPIAVPQLQMQPRKPS
jgi:hypothetical protein